MQFAKFLKFDHFSYLKVKLGPVVNLGYQVVHGGYLKGKLGSLPLFFCDIRNL